MNLAADASGAEKLLSDTWAMIDRQQPMPTGVLLGWAPDGSDDWHQLRAGGIGGSEVAAILGLSPWQSGFSLWHAKVNGWTGEPNPEQEWGHYLEPALLAWYRDKHPELSRHGVQGGTYAHRERTWQHANPDATMAPLGGTNLVVVECKKASSDDDWGTPGTDQVPPYYRVQVLWYLDTLGADRADVVVTNLGRAPEVYTVTYDADEAALLREHAEAFWRSLGAGMPPDVDSHGATYQAVRRLHPDIDGTEAVIDPWTVAEWRIARSRLARAEARSRLTTSRLLAAMGQARYAVLPDGSTAARRQPARGGSVALYNVAPKGNR